MWLGKRATAVNLIKDKNVGSAIPSFYLAPYTSPAVEIEAEENLKIRLPFQPSSP
jgi:hypothetical protein